MANITLSQLFTNICNSIRAKTGSADKIKHINIPSEIARIVSINDFLSKSVTEIETTVATVADYAFYKQSSLISVKMPNVKSIGAYAFNYCSQLKKVELPSTCKYIGASAFMECYYLENINIPDGIREIPSGCFRGDYSLKSPKIPGSVTNIGSMAFQGATFDTIDLPQVAQLGQLVFAKSSYDVTGLKTLIIRNASGVCSLSSSNSFGNTPIGKGEEGAVIYVPDSLVGNYKQSTNWSVFANIIKPLSELGV